jgi:hypothetical protein
MSTRGLFPVSFSSFCLAAALQDYFQLSAGLGTILLNDL